MNKQLYLTIVFLFSAFLGFSQKKDSGYFIMANLKYYNNVYFNTTQSVIGQVQKGTNILSISKPKTFAFSPSIIRKTKRGNLREFELRSLGYRNINVIGDGAVHAVNSNKTTLDTIPVLGTKNVSFEVSISHRYYLNFFKKAKKKYYFGLNFANSIGYSWNKNKPYVTNFSFPRNTNGLFSAFEVGYGGGYFINNRLLVSYRSTFLTTYIELIKQFIDNPFLPEIQRKQTLFNFNEQINVGFIPKNVVLSVAYKF